MPRIRCALCDQQERTGLGPWQHDRAYYARFPEQMMRVHYPWTCGPPMVREGGHWYPLAFFEQLERDGEFG
jgi:hypothetical protein